jgi:VIT1/CCC1 family predicted Fe2+/Mn2+ transporter
VASDARAERARRYRENVRAEIDMAALYSALAEYEADSSLSELYRRLGATEERHASFWEQRLRDLDARVPERRPSWRARVLVRLARRFGPTLVLPAVAGTEEAGQDAYDLQPEASGTGMRGEERSHARILRSLAGNDTGIAGTALARFERRHRAIGGNALRASVLGANDGLVSNLSLVMGVAGADLSSRAILVTGIAGLLAGACSMAMGEWVSVTSSRELYAHQLEIEREELAAFPDEEREELALLYQAKGLSREQAEALADQILADEATSLDTMAREELGIDPQELGGSAWVAAISSFVPFVAGAIVPVIPFMFLDGTAAVVTSLVASAVALFAIGAAITLLTGRSVLLSGARQLAFGLAAAGVTYGIGAAIGVSVSG